MNRKAIIAALTKLGIQFDHSSSTSVLSGLLCRTWLTVRNDAQDGDALPADYDFEMTINGQIGQTYYDDEGYSAKQFQDELKPFKGKKGVLNIHSGGGNIWDGFAIANMVKEHGNIDTKILGMAASAADVVFQAGKNRIMPKMAMRMAHNASALFAIHGNAKELAQQKPQLDKTIDRLNKHDGTLATMYSDRSGQSLDDVKADMEAEEFMDGDESLDKGYCDALTDDIPVTDHLDLSHLKHVPANVRNQFTAPTGTGKTNQPKHENTVNKKQKIALLNSWGVKLPSGVTEDSVTDQWLDDNIAKGKPVAHSANRQALAALLNSWGVTFDANANEADVEALVAKGKPAAPANANPAKIVDPELEQLKNDMRAQRDNHRRELIRNRITALAGEDRIPVNQIEDWVSDAMSAQDDPVKGNPVVNRLAALPSRAPGVPPLMEDLDVTENLNIKQLDTVVNKLLAPNASIRGEGRPRKEVQEAIAANSRKISHLVNALKKIDYSQDAKGVLSGPLRDAFDARASGITNANTMSTSLLRQVILSEIMRAFRREFASLSLFSHNYKDVALQGTDKVEVPYYPLDQVASTEFVAANGYVIGANAQTLNKEIQVGGIGNGVASPGIGRKYKPLGFSAYEIARQPYLNIAQLIVLAAEQLAIDIRADIFSTRINQAKFGNAIWTGAAGGFDKNAFTNYLLNAAIKSFWPQAMRNCILTPDFFTSLIGDPGLQQVMAAGSTESLRDAAISRLLSFGNVTYDPLFPIVNSIRGGDGAVIPGLDQFLGGFIAYPSAILIATAPIMPGPATMKLLASYEQVTDEQIGLSFSYQYFGNVLGSQDAEIIECCYGSGDGEAAALKRITTQGL